MSLISLTVSAHKKKPCWFRVISCGVVVIANNCTMGGLIETVCALYPSTTTPRGCLCGYLCVTVEWSRSFSALYPRYLIAVRRSISSSIDRVDSSRGTLRRMLMGGSQRATTHYKRVLSGVRLWQALSQPC